MCFRNIIYIGIFFTTMYANATNTDKIANNNSLQEKIDSKEKTESKENKDLQEKAELESNKQLQNKEDSINNTENTNPKETKKTENKIEYETDPIEEQHTKSIKQAIERMQKVKDSMNEVYERENINTIKPRQLSVETLQIGINDARNKEERKHAIDKVEHSEYKTQLFIGIQIGSTFAAVADNVNVLPTLNLKLGFQNFLGIASKQVGLKIYLDTFIASNILSSLKNDPYADFIDSSFSATNVNAEVMYEVPISHIMRFGVGCGFGVGYMTYHDKYWDKLNGFASNVSLLTYLSFYDRHKIELGFKTFFYHYGSYITRKLEGVVQDPSGLYSSDFAKPMNLSLGWIYVF